MAGLLLVMLLPGLAGPGRQGLQPQGPFLGLALPAAPAPATVGCCPHDHLRPALQPDAVQGPTFTPCHANSCSPCPQLVWFRYFCSRAYGLVTWTPPWPDQQLYCNGIERMQC